MLWCSNWWKCVDALSVAVDKVINVIPPLTFFNDQKQESNLVNILMGMFSGSWKTPFQEQEADLVSCVEWEYAKSCKCQWLQADKGGSVWLIPLWPALSRQTPTHPSPLGLGEVYQFLEGTLSLITKYTVAISSDWERLGRLHRTW